MARVILLIANNTQSAAGRMEAPEPARARRQGPELWSLWQHQGPPERGGRVWSYGMCGSSGDLPSREVGSRAVGCVATPEPS
jgi:hypothetical protein